jgi:hypothetical protein
VADDAGKGVPLANPAGDELDVLGTEIKNEYGTRRGAISRHELFLERTGITDTFERDTYGYVHQVYQTALGTPIRLAMTIGHERNKG